jgi:hypothetical protein
MRIAPDELGREVQRVEPVECHRRLPPPSFLERRTNERLTDKS